MTEGTTVFQEKHQLLVALLTRPIVQEAARDAGVRVSTAFWWRRQPKFKAVLDSMRRDQFEQGLHNAYSLAAETVETLRSNLSCGKPSVEVAAAVKVVDIGMKFAELSDIMRRLDNLERIPQGRGQSDQKPLAPNHQTGISQQSSCCPLVTHRSGSVRLRTGTVS